jgi:thioredoxin 1
MSDTVVHIQGNRFQDEVVRSELPVVVDFYADWCGFCQKEKPTIDKLEKEYSGRIAFMRLNNERDGDAFKKFNVSSFPTMLLITRRGSGDYQ